VPSPEDALKKLMELNITFDPNEFLGYAQQRNTAIVELFLIAGMDPNVRNQNDWTALMLVTNNADIATVETLLYYGADPNIREPLFGVTALSLATTKNHLAIIQQLKLAGAKQ
jgi:ankyrin repeat protein